MGKRATTSTKVAKKEKPKKEKKVKAKKDKNAPKKPMSAFFCFQKSRRPHITKEHPEYNNQEIIKAMTAEWKTFNDKDKEPYNQLAVEDKKRYASAMEDYNAKQGTSGATAQQASASKKKSAKKEEVKKEESEEDANDDEDNDEEEADEEEGDDE